MTYLTTIDTTFKINTLRYKKGIDKKIRLEGEDERPGWSITEAGRWMYEIELNKNKRYDLHIKPLYKKDNLYFRIVTKLIRHKSKSTKYKNTLDNPRRYKLETDEVGIKYKFYRLSANDNKFEHQFKIKGPTKVKVYTRLDKKEKSNYSLLLKEDGLKMGSFQIKWKNVEDLDHPPSEAFFFRVPKGEHFYSISVADPTSMNDDIYIRLKEYK
jgi:hypothetical protein